MPQLHLCIVTAYTTVVIAVALIASIIFVTQQFDAVQDCSFIYHVTIFTCSQKMLVENETDTASMYTMSYNKVFDSVVGGKQLIFVNTFVFTLIQLLFISDVHNGILSTFQNKCSEMFSSCCWWLQQAKKIGLLEKLYYGILQNLKNNLQMGCEPVMFISVRRSM